MKSGKNLNGLGKMVKKSNLIINGMHICTIECVKSYAHYI